MLWFTVGYQMPRIDPVVKGKHTFCYQQSEEYHSAHEWELFQFHDVDDMPTGKVHIDCWNIYAQIFEMTLLFQLLWIWMEDSIQVYSCWESLVQAKAFLRSGLTAWGSFHFFPIIGGLAPHQWNWTLGDWITTYPCGNIDLVHFRCAFFQNTGARNF